MGIKLIKDRTFENLINITFKLGEEIMSRFLVSAEWYGSINVECEKGEQYLNIEIDDNSFAFITSLTDENWVKFTLNDDEAIKKIKKYITEIN